jgi:hypothetical protein
MKNNTQVLAALTSPKRTIDAKLEYFDFETAELTEYTNKDYLKSFSVEKVGASNKFYGYGISQKLTVNMVDKNRDITLKKGDNLCPCFCVSGGSNFTYGDFPIFIITEVKRDENTNELTITAYDALYFAANYTVDDFIPNRPYTIANLAEYIANGLRHECLVEMYKFIDVPEELTSLNYENGGNFEGTETIREVLDAIAEATQTIYYMDVSNDIVFKRLNIDDEPVFTINKSNYFELESSETRKLTKVMHVTELGDNVSAQMPGAQGVTQYIRNNPLWELREDIATLVNDALMAVGGLEATQFNCTWRGNYLLELGDKIAIIGKDDSLITSYYLSSTLEYGGGLKETTDWQFDENEAETADNPTSIGEAVKKTYAKVDKINGEVEIVAKETASLRLDSQSIQATVKDTIKDVDALTQEVEAKMSADEVTIEITKALENGVTKVTTTTGFTFNEDGLNVSKSDSEINTTISEDGMTVYRKDNTVLVADNQGVRAEDLYATTFLIVGGRSRFENYGSDRTGCFWIGG